MSANKTLTYITNSSCFKEFQHSNCQLTKLQFVLIRDRMLLMWMFIVIIIVIDLDINRSLLQSLLSCDPSEIILKKKMKKQT